MRENISKNKYKELKKLYKNNEDCCLIKLNGKKLKTKELYFERLKKKLQLNESFSNNFNAYSDMMRDPFTYDNKQIIVFLIKHYDDFLSEDQSKKVIEKIFDKDIIPYFENEIIGTIKEEGQKEIHVYYVE